MAQIVEKRLLNHLLVFLQFPGPQETYVIEAKYRKFSGYFNNLCGLKLPLSIGKKRFLYFNGDESYLAKSIGEALNGMGFSAERSNVRANLKGMFPGAGSIARKPARVFEVNPLLRRLLFILLSCVTCAFGGLLVGELLSSSEEVSGTLILLTAFLTALICGVFVGRLSVFLNVAGDYFHFLWGVVLTLWMLYIYSAAVLDSWDLLSAVRLIDRGMSEEIVLHVILILMCFIFLAFGCFVYGWPTAEQKRWANSNEAISLKSKRLTRP